MNKGFIVDQQCRIKYSDSRSCRKSAHINCYARTLLLLFAEAKHPEVHMNKGFKPKRATVRIPHTFEVTPSEFRTVCSSHNCPSVLCEREVFEQARLAGTDKWFLTTLLARFMIGVTFLVAIMIADPGKSPQPPFQGGVADLSFGDF
jgi:hypothetical protein